MIQIFLLPRICFNISETKPIISTRFKLSSANSFSYEEPTRFSSVEELTSYSIDTHFDTSTTDDF